MTVWQVPVRGSGLEAGTQLDFPVLAADWKAALCIGDGIAIQYSDSKRKFGIVRFVGPWVVIEVAGEDRRIRPAEANDKMVPLTKAHVAWVVM